MIISTEGCFVYNFLENPQSSGPTAHPPPTPLGPCSLHFTELGNAASWERYENLWYCYSPRTLSNGFEVTNHRAPYASEPLHGLQAQDR